VALNRRDEARARIDGAIERMEDEENPNAQQLAGMRRWRDETL
jgi:hypothetical protein